MQHRSQTSAHRLVVRLERVLSLGSSNKKREEFYYKTQYNFVSQGKRDEIPELTPDSTQEISIRSDWTFGRKPMRGFNFVPILSNPMLIFLSGNRPLAVFLK